MKIFIVQSNLGNGGAERVGIVLAEGLTSFGHDVTILTDLNSNNLYHIDERVEVKDMVKNCKNKITKWIRAIQYIRRQAEIDKPDVIIGIMQLCAFISKIATVGIKIPIIMSEHDSFVRPQSDPLTIWEKFSKYILDRIYESVTVLTDADKKYASWLHNTVVIPNPVTFSAYTGVIEKKKKIVAAGRLESWNTKGFDILIRAWGKISKKYPEWRVEIVGKTTPDSLLFLKKISIDYGCSDSISFLGFRTDIEYIYREAAIFILSSRREGLPMVLLEAMRQGCACIATDNLGRTAEIIQNPSQGLICRSEDIEDMASSLSKMIEDENYRRMVSKGGMERIAYYSIPRIVTLWIDLIQKIRL